jgi:hypothetical protein
MSASPSPSPPPRPRPRLPRFIYEHWARDPDGVPNSQIWGHSITEFFWIQRDLRIPGLFTAWGMSMLHYLRERLSPDQRDVLAEDRSHARASSSRGCSCASPTPSRTASWRRSASAAIPGVDTHGSRVPCHINSSEPPSAQHHSLGPPSRQPCQAGSASGSETTRKPLTFALVYSPLRVSPGCYVSGRGERERRK